eukprot:scaffold1162_cov372-Prasinococcus_capsulatus_cf.AAC.2
MRGRGCRSSGAPRCPTHSGVAATLGSTHRHCRRFRVRGRDERWWRQCCAPASVCELSTRARP